MTTVTDTALVANLGRSPCSRNCGDAWLAQGRSLLLRVPSAVVGRSVNRLFNPLHPQALQAQMVSIGRYPFDERLFAGPA